MPLSGCPSAAGHSTLSALVQSNVHCLLQARAALTTVPRAVFCGAPPSTPELRVSAHTRHILEFYQCFFEGLATGTIDYNLRKRDPILEANRSAAIEHLDEILHRLDALSGTVNDLRVRIEDAACLPEDHPGLATTVERELMSLASHTIHHMALIAVALRAHGLHVDPDFGKSPATMLHEKSGSNSHSQGNS